MFRLTYEGISLFMDGIYISSVDIESTNTKSNIDPTSYPTNLNIYETNSGSPAPVTDIVIFTDGSKSDNGVGLGFVAFKELNIIKECKVKIRNNNTVFQSEATAIFYALSWFKSTVFRSVNIHSDSMSSVKALGDLYPRSPIIKDIHNVCRALEDREVNLFWIKAHVGFLGNEIADELAGAATELSTIDNGVKLPKSFVRKNLKTDIINSWQREWDASDKGRFTYSIVSKVSPSLVFKNTVINYFVTGQGSFPTFLFKIGKK